MPGHRERYYKYKGEYGVIFHPDIIAYQERNTHTRTQLAAYITQTATCALLSIRCNWGQWSWENVIGVGTYRLSRILTENEARLGLGVVQKEGEWAWEQLKDSVAGGQWLDKLAGFTFPGAPRAMLRSCWEKYNKRKMGQNKALKNQNSNNSETYLTHLCHYAITYVSRARGCAIPVTVHV